MYDESRVLALRLALIASGADNTDMANETVNGVLGEIGFGRGGLTQVLLASADLLAEELGAERITAALAAELDAQDPCTAQLKRPPS